MKTIIAISILLTSAFAEPPVDNRYLPPNHGFNGGGLPPPSEAYGPPGFGTPGRTDSGIRRPPTNFGSPLNTRRPNQYVPPARRPSNEYGPPASEGLGRPGSRFGQRPGTEYGAPNPSEVYGAPNSGYGGNQQYPQNGGLNNLDQSRKYLPPAGRQSYNGEEENSQPANYNFEYTVKDDASGNDFGHRESRMGDRAEGVYYVVLPDGRKQTVAYEADENGYRPKISYEDVGANGYNRGLNNGYQGNQEGY